MNTLKSIHGPDFKFDNSSKYRNHNQRLKKFYWQDKGQLVIQSISNYSNSKAIQNKIFIKF